VVHPFPAMNRWAIIVSPYGTRYSPDTSGLSEKAPPFLRGNSDDGPLLRGNSSNGKYSWHLPIGVRRENLPLIALQGGNGASTPSRINLGDSNPVRGEMFVETGTTNISPTPWE
jgi:hypothetical protein